MNPRVKPFSFFYLLSKFRFLEWNILNHHEVVLPLTESLQSQIYKYFYLPQLHPSLYNSLNSKKNLQFILFTLAKLNNKTRCFNKENYRTIRLYLQIINSTIGKIHVSHTVLLIIIQLNKYKLNIYQNKNWILKLRLRIENILLLLWICNFYIYSLHFDNINSRSSQIIIIFINI